MTEATIDSKIFFYLPGKLVLKLNWVDLLEEVVAYRTLRFRHCSPYPYLWGFQIFVHRYIRILHDLSPDYLHRSMFSSILTMLYDPGFETVARKVPGDQN